MASRVDKKEPAPLKSESPFVQEQVLLDLAVLSDPVLRSMSYDLGDRAEFGFRKYGTYLQANNGRNAVMDAYQEALDLVVYLKQCCMEGKSLELEYQSALGIARQLCRTLIG